MGKCKQPTASEIRKKEERNATINREAEERIADRRKKWDL
jgi:hypothetical protein